MPASQLREYLWYGFFAGIAAGVLRNWVFGLVAGVCCAGSFVVFYIARRLWREN